MEVANEVLIGNSTDSRDVLPGDVTLIFTVALEAVFDLGLYPNVSACETTDDRNCAEFKKDSFKPKLATSPFK